MHTVDRRSAVRLVTSAPREGQLVDELEDLEPLEQPIPYVLADLASAEGLAAAVGRVLVVVCDVEPIDWDNIAPHPRLAELDEVCSRCGVLRGGHDVAAPQGRLADCEGFSSTSKAGAR